MSRREEIERIIVDAEHEAYARGYADAIAAATAAAAAAAPKLTEARPESAAVVSEPNTNSDRRRGRPAKAITLVSALIFAKPGMKGIQVARELELRGTPVNERTVRSCLRRLRETRIIWKRNGCWYPKPKESTQATLTVNTNEEVLGTPPH